MAKKDIKNEYCDEDFLFLLLELIDFPEKEKKVFKFDEFKWLKYKRYPLVGILKSIVGLKNQTNNLEIGNCSFNPFQIEATFGKSKKMLVAGIRFADKFPLLDETISLKKILTTEFNFSDIENIATSEILDPSKFIRGINFKITVKKEFQAQIEKNIQHYCIDLFCENKLKNETNRYCTFENHKLSGFEKIKKITNKTGKETTFKDSDFIEEFRFLEFMLSLHFLKYIEIKSTSLDSNGAFAISANVKEKLLDEAKKNDKKSEKKIIKPLLLPAGATWENIKIQFVDEFEIEIFIKGDFFEKIDYSRLSCFDLKLKEKNPDVQWQMFRKLAITRGKLDLRINPDIKKKIDREKQKKKKLTRRLKELFCLKDDPFFPLPDTGMFQTRFKLEPESILRGDGEFF
jgi:hypothetical protein